MSTLREELTNWCKAHMTPGEDGRWYATEQNAADLQAWLRERGFDEAVVTVKDGRFEVERQP